MEQSEHNKTSKDGLKEVLKEDLGRPPTEEEFQAYYAEVTNVAGVDTDVTYSARNSVNFNDNLSTYEISERKIIGNYMVDEADYLIHFDDWSPEFASIVANKDNIDLSHDHWEVINYLREYYIQNKMSPRVRDMYKAMRKKNSYTKEYISQLFPTGLWHACRYAGYPQIRGQI